MIEIILGFLLTVLTLISSCYMKMMGFNWFGNTLLCVAVLRLLFSHITINSSNNTNNTDKKE